MTGIRTCRPLAPERSFLMAIDRHDSNGSAVDDAPAAGDRGGRQADSFPREMTGDRPVPDERRSRGDLYSALRDTDAAADHHPPSSPDAPRTTKDGGWEWKGLRLGPDANRVADEELSARRTAEGRSGDGNYRDRGITPAMRRIEAKLEHGTLVPDTEKFALKSPDRFKEKLAKLIERRPGSSARELASEIHDGIRYTFLFETQHYITETQTACASLTKDRYDLTRLANLWDGDEYKGINSRWLDPRSGQSFEVQFHTPESWDAKQRTHDTYEKINNPTTPVEEVETLRAFQRAVTSSIPLPDHLKEITDYRKPGS
jgi:hypothetical protein